MGEEKATEQAGVPVARVVNRRYEGRSEQRLDCVHWTEDPRCALYRLGTIAEPHLPTCAECKAYERDARMVR